MYPYNVNSNDKQNKNGFTQKYSEHTEVDSSKIEEEDVKMARPPFPPGGGFNPRPPAPPTPPGGYFPRPPGPPTPPPPPDGFNPRPPGPPIDNGMPPGPPPAMTPREMPSLYKVDPGSIRGCLYQYTYVWLVNGQSFWMYPTYVGRKSIAGYRYGRHGWVYAGFDLDLIESFYCVPY